MYLVSSLPSSGASLWAWIVKDLLAMWETQVLPLGWEDLLEKEMATDSNILAWKIPWTEEPGRLQSLGSQRVGHDWPANTHTHTSLIYNNLAMINQPHCVRDDFFPVVSLRWVLKPLPGSSSSFWYNRSWESTPHAIQDIWPFLLSDSKQSLPASWAITANVQCRDHKIQGPHHPPMRIPIGSQWPYKEFPRAQDNSITYRMIARVWVLITHQLFQLHVTYELQVLCI